MIKLILAVGVIVTFLVRWRPGTASRVVKHKGIGHLIATDILAILVVLLQLLGFSEGSLRATPYFQYAGIVFFVAGCFLAGVARLSLGGDYMPAFNTKISKQITKNGPYRIVRHPVYLGSLLEILGFELAMNSWLVLAIIIFIPVVIGRINKEERLLSEAHGREWAELIKRTKFKLVPLIY